MPQQHYLFSYAMNALPVSRLLFLISIGAFGLTCRMGASAFSPAPDPDIFDGSNYEPDPKPASWSSGIPTEQKNQSENEASGNPGSPGDPRQKEQQQSARGESKEKPEPPVGQSSSGGGGMPEKNHAPGGGKGPDAGGSGGNQAGMKSSGQGDSNSGGKGSGQTKLPPVQRSVKIGGESQVKKVDAPPGTVGAVRELPELSPTGTPLPPPSGSASNSNSSSGSKVRTGGKNKGQHGGREKGDPIPSEL